MEIAPAPWTDSTIVEKARRIYQKAGQVPIILRKEHPGFVLNRLQAALLAEAFRIVGEAWPRRRTSTRRSETASACAGPSWGRSETIELNAPSWHRRHYCARYGPSLTQMAKECEGGDPFGGRTVGAVLTEWGDPPSPTRVKRLADWRDGRLAALKAHKRAAKRKPA